jgi:hypothetical protein
MPEGFAGSFSRIVCRFRHSRSLANSANRNALHSAMPKTVNQNFDDNDGAHNDSLPIQLEAKKQL